MPGRYVEAGDGYDWVEDPAPYVPKAEGALIAIPGLNITAPSSIAVNLATNPAYQNLMASSGETGMTAQEAQGFLAPATKDIGNGMVAQYSPITGELQGFTSTQQTGGSYDLTGTFQPYQNEGWSLGGFLGGALSGVEDLATSDAVKALAPMALSAGLGGASGVGELFGLSGTTGAIAGGAALGGGTAALTGGDIGQGLLTGAIGGAGSNLSSSLAQSLGLSGTAGSIIGGAGTGALISLAQGGDPSLGLVTGGLKGLLQGLAQSGQMTVPMEGPPLPPGFDQYLAVDSGLTVPVEAPTLPSSFDQYLAPVSNVTVPIQADILANNNQFIDSISQYQEPFVDTTLDIPFTPEPVTAAPVLAPVETPVPTTVETPVPAPVPEDIPEMVITAPPIQTVPTQLEQQPSLDQFIQDISQYEVPAPSMVDYSLSGTGPTRLEDMNGAQGIQVPAVNEPVTVADSPVDYSLNTSVPFEGLQMPTIPNLDSMGGGQGLSVAVPGGTVAEGGFVPTGTLPSLGDPASFINNPTAIEEAIAATPAPTGMSKEQFTAILKGLTGLFGTSLLSGSNQPAVQQRQNNFVAPTQGLPTYSPAYFQQIQQGYNQLLPNQPRDVATPLQNWYNTPYSGRPDSVTSQLFGVI